jgi:hypothetical protein
MREVLQKPTHMEALNVSDGNGQSYGYIVYRYIVHRYIVYLQNCTCRKEVALHAGSVLTIRGHPRDLVQVTHCSG